MIRLYYSADPLILFREGLNLYNLSHPDYSRITYITPSSLRAMFAVRVFHRLVNLERGKNCYIPPDITTLRELSKRLNSMYGLKVLIKEPMIPILISRLSDKGIGLSVLISELIRDLKQYHPFKEVEELRDQLVLIVKDLNIPDSLKGSIINALGAFKDYQESLNKNNLIDDYDLLKLSVEHIRQHLNPDVTIIDGFYSPTRVEMEFIKALVERSEHSVISIPFIEGMEGITRDYMAFLKEHFAIKEVKYNEANLLSHQSNIFHPYNDIEMEVEGIARHIKSLFISGKIRDLSQVVVAFPNLSKYEKLIERVFYRYGIPFNITRNKPIGQRRPIIDLFCLIQSVIEDYPRLRFSQFLSSIYFKGIPESLRAWVPYLSLQSGIISGKEAWLGFFSKGNERCNVMGMISNSSQNMTLFENSSLTIADTLKNIEKDLRDIFTKLKPLEEIRKSASLSIFSMRLREVLTKLGFLDATPFEEEYRAYSDLKRYLWESLDALSFLERVNPSALNLREFSEYLWHILNNTYIGEEREGVVVTDISGAFFLSFLKNIYLGGLTDDDMPNRGSPDYILPDSIRRNIGLPDLERRIMLQKFLFENIVRSKAKLHLSYPLSEGENKFLPSPFLYSGQAEKVKVPGIFSMEELLVTKGERPLSEFLSEIEVSPVISLKEASLNVTDIDSYRACPRRFFIEKILRLTPPAIKEFDLEATALGEIIHKVMERIIFEPLGNLDSLRNKTWEIMEEVTEGRNIDPFWKGIIRDAFIEILPEILKRETEIRRNGYFPLMVEKNITGEPLKGIRLKGKIDRIDQSETGIAIIDYKTGSDTLTCSRVLNGKEKLQLFLYAALLKAEGYKIDRVGLYSLKDITVKWCPPKKTRKDNAIGIDEMITASLRFLEETVEGMRKGIFRARPLDDNYFLCRRCHENPNCPYIQS